ncbi:E3 ubiquitin-protein ligase [Musa troglodytarum]|uniref:E3 ubiquitin-protein ligase n=1 Tax=Musa troglodytarum TaxID=320322 RepID=A0A9E7H476_9LILI|nr:E3 ubiquitin-protein ligase [Musa troglodytarum]
MGLLEREFLRKYVLFTFVLLGLLVGSAAGNVVLIGRNVSLSFPDVEANFVMLPNTTVTILVLEQFRAYSLTARPIKRSGECGVLYVAEPLDACGPLTNQVGEGSGNPFALIIRGGCTFDAKVRSAQNAGFKAAIVYDNEDNGIVISMSGNPVGIHIHAVFISKASGEIVKKYAGRAGLEFWIIPTIDNSAWSIMAISFISLLAMSAVLAMCFFVRRHRIRREQPQVPYIREFHGMSSRLVKAMPSLIFTSVLDDNCTSTTCAICLEDYTVGEKIRILPCRHKFHAFCVDCWLTSWRTFCPVCKQDVRASIANLPASEGTPLLSSGAATPASNAGLSSYHSSMAASPAIHISTMPPGHNQIPGHIHSLAFILPEWQSRRMPQFPS